MSEPKIKAWSYSLYKDYCACPFKAKCRAVTRVKTTAKPNPAMERGITIHKYAEHYLLGDITKLPKELQKFEVEFKNLKDAYADAEKDLAVTRSWMPSSFDDWMNVWCRAKADAVHLDKNSGALTIIDFKTGKMYSENAEQLELYVPLAVAHYGTVKSVEVELWYLDSGEVPTPRTYLQPSFNKIKSEWEKRVKDMMTDSTFEATPSDSACRWCPYKDSDGGPCRAWRDK